MLFWTKKSYNAEEKPVKEEITHLQLQIGRIFTEIAELRGKYNALEDLYQKQKSRLNRQKTEESENILIPTALETANGPLK